MRYSHSLDTQLFHYFWHHSDRVHVPIVTRSRAENGTNLVQPRTLLMVWCQDTCFGLELHHMEIINPIENSPSYGHHTFTPFHIVWRIVWYVYHWPFDASFCSPLISLVSAQVQVGQVWMTGFEPATPCSQSRCSAKLSHIQVYTWGLWTVDLPWTSTLKSQSFSRCIRQIQPAPDCHEVFEFIPRTKTPFRVSTYPWIKPYKVVWRPSVRQMELRGIEPLSKTANYMKSLRCLYSSLSPTVHHSVPIKFTENPRLALLYS